MLRKGMGKKIKSVVDKMKPKFMKGCEVNGFNLEKVEKVWTDWEKFVNMLLISLIQLVIL